MSKVSRMVGAAVILTALAGAGVVARGEGEPAMTEQAGGAGDDLGEGFCVSFGEEEDVYWMQGKGVGPHGMQPVAPEQVEEICGKGFGK